MLSLTGCELHCCERGPRGIKHKGLEHPDFRNVEDLQWFRVWGLGLGFFGIRIRAV